MQATDTDEWIEVDDEDDDEDEDDDDEDDDGDEDGDDEDDDDEDDQKVNRYICFKFTCGLESVCVYVCNDR